MRHAPTSDSFAKSTLRSSGVNTFDDLFADIPEEVRRICLLSETSEGSKYPVRSQFEARALVGELADESPFFIGAGLYDHYIPISVEHLVGRSEFYSDDAPCHSEISQSLSQAIFECRKVVCRLTGMDFSSVSLYRGGSALVQACLIAAERTNRRLILIPETLNPDHAQIVKACSSSELFEPCVVPEKNGLVDLEILRERLDVDGENVAAVVIQYPNFYGNLERVSKIIAATKEVGALAITSVDPIALAMLKSPGEWGADVAVCDCRPLGFSTSFDDPRFGFIATAEKSTRDRRFRRDQANLSARSNDASNALTALAYLAFVEPGDLRRAANASREVAQYARAALKKARFEFQHDAPFFREFAVKVDDPRGMNLYLRKWGIIGGYELKDGLLLAFTEKRTREEVDELVYFMKKYQFEDAKIGARK